MKIDPPLTAAEQAEWDRLTNVTRLYLFPGHPKRAVQEAPEYEIAPPDWASDELFEISEREAIANE